MRLPAVYRAGASHRGQSQPSLSGCVSSGSQVRKMACSPARARSKLVREGRLHYFKGVLVRHCAGTTWQRGTLATHQEGACAASHGMHGKGRTDPASAAPRSNDSISLIHLVALSILLEKDAGAKGRAEEARTPAGKQPVV